jgi:hypothetical protein
MRSERFIATRFLRVLACITAASVVAAAQTIPQRPLQPEDLGTVTGHILCADTQRPARLAEVRLVPLQGSDATAKDSKSNFNEDSVGASLPPIETDMTGSFTVHNVHPGQYYLRVDLGGYLTPLAGFSREQFSQPSPEIKLRMNRELQIVSVLPHATVQADASLLRGASISGTVLYDDGTPAIGLPMSLFQKDAKGAFTKEVQASARYTLPSDERGHYSFSSLPAGDYVIAADISFSTYTVSMMPLSTGTQVQMSMATVLFDLPIFSGNALRRRDASPVTVGTGENRPAVDITIPLNKLHQVSGSLVAQDGHTLNSGRVTLLYADDRAELTHVNIDRDDKEFHFPYVPEGTYLLNVTDAHDMTQIQVANPAGFTPRFHNEDNIVVSYGTAEQPLEVQSDVVSVIASVPDKPKSTPAAQ